MATVIILPDLGLDSFYNYVMAYLDQKYHHYPKVFEDLYIPEDQLAEMASWNAYASSFQADCGSDAPPVGKQVL